MMQISAALDDHPHHHAPVRLGNFGGDQGAVPVITIPQPIGGVMRYLIGAFMWFWLGG